MREEKWFRWIVDKSSKIIKINEYRRRVRSNPSTRFILDTFRQGPMLRFYRVSVVIVLFHINFCLMHIFNGDGMISHYKH